MHASPNNYQTLLKKKRKKIEYIKVEKLDFRSEEIMIKNALR